MYDRRAYSSSIQSTPSSSQCFQPSSTSSSSSSSSQSTNDIFTYFHHPCSSEGSIDSSNGQITVIDQTYLKQVGRHDNTLNTSDEVNDYSAQRQLRAGSLHGSSQDLLKLINQSSSSHGGEGVSDSAAQEQRNSVSTLSSPISTASDCIEVIASPIRASRPYSARTPKSSGSWSSWLHIALGVRNNRDNVASLSPTQYSCVSCRSANKNDTCQQPRVSPSSNYQNRANLSPLNFSQTHNDMDNRINEYHDESVNKQVSSDFELPPAANTTCTESSFCLVSGNRNTVKTCGSEYEHVANGAQVIPSHLPPFPSAPDCLRSIKSVDDDGNDGHPNEQLLKKASEYYHFTSAPTQQYSLRITCDCYRKYNGLLCSLPWDVLSRSVFEFLDVRDIHRLQCCCKGLRQSINFTTLPSKEFIIHESAIKWNLWTLTGSTSSKNTKEDGIVLSPTQFQNRSISFFDAVPSTLGVTLDLRPSCHHLTLGGWWNSLTPQTEFKVLQLLSTSNLQTIKVEPTFYDCLCHSCRDVRSHVMQQQGHQEQQQQEQGLQNTYDSNRFTEFHQLTPPRQRYQLRHRSPIVEPSPLFLGNPSNSIIDGQSPALISPFSLPSIPNDRIHSILTPTRQSLLSNDTSHNRLSAYETSQSSFNNAYQLLPFYVNRITRPFSSSAMRNIRQSDRSSPQRQLQRLRSFYDERRDVERELGRTQVQLISNNIDTEILSEEQENEDFSLPFQLHRSNTQLEPQSNLVSQDSSIPLPDAKQHEQYLQNLVVAKRHACARFFYVFRLMLLSRSSLQAIDFGTPSFVYSTICDDGASLPDFPINLRFHDQHFDFPKLKELKFGVTIDCRFIVPIIDFCKYCCLKQIEILGLRLRYELYSPQFGTKPLMVFGPQQTFTSALNDGSPLWLPALYNGGTDENLQLQDRGVYVSREYHYEGTFKDGRNDGFGKMISKCGEIYEGEWRNGRRHGFGVVIQSDGKRLEGQWIKDVLNGCGSMTMVDGLKYEGEWVNGALEGWGILSRGSELLAIGQFQDGRPQGWMACRNSYLDDFPLQLKNNSHEKEEPNEEGDVQTPSFAINGNRRDKIKLTADVAPQHSNGDNDIEHDIMLFDTDEVSLDLANEEDITYELDTIITLRHKNTNYHNVSYEQYCSSSLLEQLLKTPGWISTWRYSISTIELHQSSFQLLKNPPTLDDVFLLNSNLMKQQPGLLQHSQRPSLQRSSAKAPEPPSWIKDMIKKLSWLSMDNT